MKSKLFKLLKSVLFIAFLVIISYFIFFMTAIQSMDKPASERINITDFYYSLGFIVIWLLFAFWSGYKHSKEILIVAILYASLPILNTLSYSLKPQVESAIFKPSFLLECSVVWSFTSIGLMPFFINIFGRPVGIYIYQFIENYYSLIMLVLFVITYFLASKISLSKKLKAKAALDVQPV